MTFAISARLRTTTGTSMPKVSVIAASMSAASLVVDGLLDGLLVKTAWPLRR